MESTTQARISLFLKGMAMGIADAVPGVSGGTIAVISGIYENLVNALRSCNPMSLKVLWQQGLPAFWRTIHGTFLLTLGLGILSSLVIMANTVLWLLDNHRMLVMGFFIGLILASCFLLSKQVTHWNVRAAGLFGAGFVLTAATAWFNPVAGSDHLLYVFVSGAIAICAMILPGISGAFILILLGMYEYVLDALRQMDLVVIAVFAAGCAIGLLSFSHVLSWTFYYYREQTYAALTGMLAASLLVLWPEQEMQHASSVGIAATLALACLGGATIMTFARLSGAATSEDRAGI